MTTTKVHSGKWGTNKRAEHVHFFITRTDNGRTESLCGRMRYYDVELNARLNMSNWIPEDPRTCKMCCSMIKWMKPVVSTVTQKVENATA